MVTSIEEVIFVHMRIRYSVTGESWPWTGEERRKEERTGQETVVEKDERVVPKYRLTYSTAWMNSNRGNESAGYSSPSPSDLGICYNGDRRDDVAGILWEQSRPACSLPVNGIQKGNNDYRV